MAIWASLESDKSMTDKRLLYLHEKATTDKHGPCPDVVCSVQEMGYLTTQEINRRGEVATTAACSGDCGKHERTRHMVPVGGFRYCTDCIMLRINELVAIIMSQQNHGCWCPGSRGLLPDEQHSGKCLAIKRLLKGVA